MSESIPESGPAGSDPTGSDPTGFDQTGSNPTDVGQTGSDQTGSDRAGSDRAGFNQTGSERTGSERTGSERTGSERTSFDRAGFDRTGFGRAGSDRAGSDEAALDQAGLDHTVASPDEVGTDLVVVTGLSGGGRSTVARALENVGFYVVDNLPQALMLDMAQLAFEAGGAARRTAMVLDVRSRAFSTDLAGAVRALHERGFSPRVVFVDADDEVLIRRFESVRRSHPLQGDGRLADGIAAERKLLEEAREQADVIIDTSHLNVNQLRRRVEELFSGEDARRLRITVLSFGFKYGLPPDADYVMDARFLPNPFWVPELRDHTGLEEAVSGFVLGQEGAHDFVSTYAGLIAATATGFEREGKRYLTVAIGCTGGKHRSVAIAEELTSQLRDIRLSAHSSHRDLGRE